MGIRHHVQDRLLLDIDSLKVHADQRIGLIGRNGCGKTTLLRIMAGQLRPDEGHVSVRTSICLVPQFKTLGLPRSEGEITQACLQQALQANAGLLILDEPTTHLDMDHIEWLEKELLDYRGGLVIVSHDRGLLDQLCTEIWEIDEGSLTAYKGNYSDYARQRELERRAHQAEFEIYEKTKQQLEAAIRKKEERAQRATKKPKRLSSSEARITGAKPYYAKKQKKLRKTASALETRLQQLPEVLKPKKIRPVKMTVLNEDDIRSKIIVRGEQVSGRVGSRVLWEPFSFYVRGGDKMAILGPNGAGKTTLLKKLVHNEGGISVSPAVRVGYFPQDISILAETKTVLENVRLSSRQNETTIRTVLASMQFRGPDVHKKVQVLSGGERVKAALAKLFLSDVNVLVLDEPTNFLDIESMEALEALMGSYSGTIIFVTHDRHLVKNTATRILEINGQTTTVSDDPYRAGQERSDQPESNFTASRLLLIETRISEVLSRLSLEPSPELDEVFKRLLKEKKEIEDGPGA